MDDVDANVLKEFAGNYDYVPGRVKETASFAKALHAFARSLGEKYYSESMGKKIHLFALDLDALLLRGEHLRLQAERFYTELEKGFLQKKKVSLDKKAMERFKQELDQFDKELESLYQQAVGLTKDIRAEVERKERL